MPEQKIDQQDILLVQNIDLNCEIYDEENQYNHRDYFMVKWDGVPHKIVPGGTRRMPRYIAEHYAKHLADHMLMKMQESGGGKRNYMTDKTERSKMMGKIILGVEQFFYDEPQAVGGEAVAKQVDELNKDDAIDVGMVETISDTVETARTRVSEIKAPVVEMPEDISTEVATEAPTKAKRTRAELMLECETLGIETSNRDTVEQLEGKLAKF